MGRSWRASGHVQMSRPKSGSKRRFGPDTMTIHSNIPDVSPVVKKRWQQPWRTARNWKMTTVLARWLDATFRRHIDKRVAERTEHLRLEAGRVEAALRAAKMHVFFQDRDLRYTT